MQGTEFQLLAIEPLTATAFAPFGDVIEADAASEVFPINDGTAQRHHAIARVDCAALDGEPLISLVRAQPRALPFDIVMLERHPLGSQAFVPLSPSRYIVVVAAAPDAPPRAFLAADGQGINYRRGVWHHPLLALEQASDFLVIDRGGAGDNCDEVQLTGVYRLSRDAWPNGSRA